MTIIEQIKAEIERQIKDPQEHCYGVSSINKLRELLDFIDTLEGEKPMQDELEKEIDAVWGPRFNLGWDEKSLLSINRSAFETIARHFAKWGADHTPLPEDTVLFNKGIEEGKRLMKESIENHIDELNDKYLGGVYSSYDMAKAYAEGHLDGQKWQKEQMMKDAVKWLVDDDYHEASEKGRFILGSVGLGYNGYYIPYLDLLKLPKED